MNIVITGGCGFLGAGLARALLNQEHPERSGPALLANSTLFLVDQAAAPPDLAAHPRVRTIQGDLNALLASGQAIPAGTGLVFHLAAAVSGECEADFDLGLRSNLAATQALLEACRKLGTNPLLVYASSLAVFGFAPGQPHPEWIDDDSLPTPQTSYGIQKFIGEQLVADYTRKGFVQGRSVRPMTVSVRAGKPNGAASGFYSGMLREPLAGIRSRVPVPPDTAVALASPASTVAGLLRAAQASADQWGARTAINLPALCTTVSEMAQALADIAGPEAAQLLDWEPDEAIMRIVATWPARVRASRAAGLGLQADASIHSIVRQYIAAHPQAVLPAILARVRREPS